jgi:hypothetical protein
MLRTIVVTLCSVSVTWAALPVPPHQHDPWQPPGVSGMPQFVADLASLFFDAGLADPRGGEYREVELSLPGWRQPVSIHAWYFPQGFAVAWDGLVHPVLRLGQRSDLWQDVAAAKPNSNREARANSPLVAEPVGVMLLLRVGEPELARRLFAASLIEKRWQWVSDASKSWLSSAFHQAVEAHASANDQLAMDLSDLLIRARPSFESAWQEVRAEEAPQVTPSLLGFLDPVPVIRADSERRLTQAPRKLFNPAALESMTASARIAELIDRLEDVDERQRGQPGYVPLMDSPICKALAANGAEAVEPLLDALENDRRLTRSYGYAPRSWFPPRDLISVAQAAEAVLRDYYHLFRFPWEDAQKRRAWLLRNKYTSQPERYFDLLSDDAANEIQWFDAATDLVDGSAEELRDRKNPSVSELLAKRVSQMQPSSLASAVALALYQWDPHASLPSLQKISYYPMNRESQLIAARLQLGDETAGQEWAQSLRPDQVMRPQELAPLWASPENETLKAVARSLFLGPSAPMSLSNLLKSNRSVEDLVRSPLLIQAAFREAVFEALEQSDAVGSAEPFSDGRLSVRFPNMSMECTQRGGCGGPKASYSPGKRDVRVQDVVAWSLSRIEGFPAFDIGAPTEEKNDCIAQIQAFLRSHAAYLVAPPIGTRENPQPRVSLIAR